MRCDYPQLVCRPIHTISMYLHARGREIQIPQILEVFRDIAAIASLIQLVLLAFVMFTGEPGVYQEEFGLMYISDNFCKKPILAALFFISTLPSWTLLACSVALEKNIYRRNLILALIALPLPLGMGVVFFSICNNQVLHYIYVNLFVFATATVHLVITKTAGHFVFLQSYFFLLVGTSIVGAVFLLLAVGGRAPSMRRDAAVVFEYLAMSGFIILNSLSADRIREHINIDTA
jgi:hypothetical protein